MAFIVFYVLCFPLAILSLFVRRLDDKLISVFIVVSYLLFFGLAYKFGVDWLAYYESYTTGEMENDYFEIGYKVVESCGQYLGIDYWVFSFSVKIFYWACCLSLVFRFSNNTAITIFLTMMLSCVFLNDFIRQLLAAGFVFIAIMSVNKSFWRFLIFILIASLFHQSALLVAPFYLIYRSKLLENILIFVMVFFFFLNFSNFSILKIILMLAMSTSYSFLFERLAYYSGLAANDVSVGHIIRFCILILGVLLYRNLESKIKEIYRIVYVGFIFFFAYEMLFYDVNTLWTRMREYFSVFIPILMMMLLPRYKISMFAFLSIYAAYTFYGISLNNEKLYNNYLNYQNVVSCWVDGCDSVSKERDQEAERYWSEWVENNK